MKLALLILSLLANVSPSVAHGALATDDILARLNKAYPGQIEGIRDNRLIFKDGFAITFDDGIAGKSANELFDNPDVKDMFRWVYPLTPLNEKANEDPGRIRSSQFFAHIYGDCLKGDVEKNLVEVRWLGKQSLKVTPINGVADQLKKISDEILSEGKDVVLAASPSAGTYNCRVIAGTTRQSAHGLGIAIDVNVKVSDYWRWHKGPMHNLIPTRLVAIFEKHGFIWGGKWAHFDTMHFEYRPELLP